MNHVQAYFTVNEVSDKVHDPFSFLDIWNFQLYCTLQEITRVKEYKRCKIRNIEIHSKQYKKVVSRDSSSVSICYLINQKVKLYYGKVNKFLELVTRSQVFQLALVTTFLQTSDSALGTIRLEKTEHQTGKIIDVSSIDHKIILQELNNMYYVLEIPKE